MDDNLFSISMTNYNKGEYIGQAIRSVLEQTHENWQLIIVDDGSTDNSVEVVNSFKDDRITLVKMPTNMGVSNGHLIAFEKAKGKLIGILDSDDVLTNDALAEMFAFAKKCSMCGLMFSNYFHCDKNLEVLKVKRNRIPKGGSILYDEHAISHFKVFSKHYYNKSARFNPKQLRAADRDITLKMEEVGGLAHLDKELYFYRYTDKGISTRIAGNHIEARHYFDMAIREAKRRRGID